MPNHVTNRITVTGDAQSVAELFAGCFRKQKPEVPDWWHAKAKDESIPAEKRAEWQERIAKREAEEPFDVFDFGMIIPVPAFIANGSDGLVSGSREDNTGRNWYRFNSEAWGTKWNAYDLSIKENTDGRLVFTFDTAWSEPHPVIATLMRWFPELHITHEFFDEGHCFYGYRRFHGGRNVDDNYHTKKEEAPGLFCRLCTELKGYDPEANDDSDE